MKKIIAVIITFSIVFGFSLLFLDFTLENIASYKILQPILIAFGVMVITYLFFWKKK